MLNAIPTVYIGDNTGSWPAPAPAPKTWEYAGKHYGEYLSVYDLGPRTSPEARIYANGGDDVVVGYVGNDSLFGDDGNDHLYAHGSYGGVDALFGGDGNDRLYGSNNGFANDVTYFWGGKGNDQSFCGDGKDVIKLGYEGAGDKDLVFNFSPQDGDKLDLGGKDIIAFLPGSTSTVARMHLEGDVFVDVYTAEGEIFSPNFEDFIF